MHCSRSSSPDRYPSPAGACRAATTQPGEKDGTVCGYETLYNAHVHTEHIQVITSIQQMADQDTSHPCHTHSKVSTHHVSCRALITAAVQRRVSSPPFSVAFKATAQHRVSSPCRVVRSSQQWLQCPQQRLHPQTLPYSLISIILIHTQPQGHIRIADPPC